MDPNQLAQALVQRGGYNPQDAQNAAKGPRAQELAREFGVQSSQSFGGGDFGSMIGLQQEAIKPAVQSLESQKAPLQERYKSILESIKGKEQTDITQAQTAASQEFGKRGIPLSSGAFSDFLAQKTQPISSAYAGLQAETGLQEQRDLMNIASQIAQLQSGASQTGIQQALQQSQFNQSQQLSQQQANKADTQIVDVGGRRKLINTQTGQTIQDLGSTSAPSTGGNINSYYDTETNAPSPIKQVSSNPPSFSPGKPGLSADGNWYFDPQLGWIAAQ